MSDRRFYYTYNNKTAIENSNEILIKNDAAASGLKQELSSGETGIA